jgi:1,4-alpha-glucan branching enzyme
MADGATHIDPAIAQALADGSCGDPFAVLGPHPSAHGCVVRAFLPGARAVELIAADGEQCLAPMQPIQIDGLFAAVLPVRAAYRLRIHWPNALQICADPYAFGLLLGELDLHLLAEGTHYQLAACLGAQSLCIDGVDGVRFAVWAPNARRVSVVGDFNSWDGRRHPLRKRIEAGVWELFVPQVGVGALYQFEILGPDGLLPLKTDPVARQVEAPPRTAAVVAGRDDFHWSDADWMARRTDTQQPQRPLSIYELHADSWRRREHNRAPSWDELADELIPYVHELGFTHIELLPVMAHPFGGSWGYQPLGLFAPQPTFGEPAAFARFVDRCHEAGIGVILDWVPAHFPSDAHGLARFDGTALYEHEDPREGYHQDWNTLIYNLGRREVTTFLLASALHWLEHFHIDGLRVDAVASLLYRDYSRAAGEWIPNRHGGRENLEAIDFLRRLNDLVAQRCPGALVIAEESTAWPGVTRSIAQGGLGFGYKWNMGWMHDTLGYMALDPVHRAWHADKITFGLLYAFSEKFVLALSHDEVVHGKGSLLRKMAGDAWQRFANLRAYYAFVWTHPGKKLLFMGGEFAQDSEWNHDGELSWQLLQQHSHAGVHRLVADLNALYRNQPALFSSDDDSRGFQWIVCDDHAQSVFAFCRHALNQAAPPVLVVCNFTPVPRLGYRVGVPKAGRWREVINTDAQIYGGANVGNIGAVVAEALPCHGHAHSIGITAPPLATVIFIGDSP